MNAVAVARVVFVVGCQRAHSRTEQFFEGHSRASTGIGKLIERKENQVQQEYGPSAQAVGEAKSDGGHGGACDEKWESELAWLVGLVGLAGLAGLIGLIALP